MTLHCIEGIVEATSTGRREGRGPTIRRELVRVRDATGIEIRMVNIMLTSAMDTYLGTVTTGQMSAKLYVARHEDHERKETNILFAIRDERVDYCEAEFWDAERVVAVKLMSRYTYLGYFLAAIVLGFFFFSVIAGILTAIVAVPILVFSKVHMGKVWRRLGKMKTAAEMRVFIAETEVTASHQLVAS